MKKGRRKGVKLAIKASAMTFQSPNADAARWKRIGPLGGKVMFSSMWLISWKRKGLPI
jgi:hypothetical protein